MIGIVYVLTEGWEPVGFICMPSIALSIDEIACILLKTVTIPRGAGVTTLVMESRPGLAMRVVVSVCFLVVLLFSRSLTVVRDGRSWILSSNLTRGVSGQALNFTVLRGVWQGLHQYGSLS